MSSENDPIIAEFVVESREHLADIENQLLAIEADGANINVDLVNEVFRAIHSIKGAAGFLGFSVLGELAHSLENVLNLIRNQELVPDSTNTDVMLRAADVLREMVNDIHNSNNFETSEHVAALHQIVSGPSSGNDSSDAVVAADTKQKSPKRPKAAAKTKAKESRAPAPAPPAEDAAAAASAAAEVSESAQTDATPANPSGQQAAAAAAKPAAPADTNIRVSVSLLDNLMNLAGELVLSRNQLLQAVNSVDGTGLDSVAARVNQVTSELQEAIMQTRMQVVGTVFNKFPRVVRDLSSQLGKQCQLTLEGEDVELDKSVIEAISDPLTHLIRNSVDHGIESPEARAAAGKRPQGTVLLKAYHQAGKVNISISDDGAGMDPAKLRNKAIEHGVLTQEQAGHMGDREALRLIFHPGLSLAAKVTDISGRGVGMDVVKTNIEKLGGAVSVESQLGVGTTINVKLPLTLAIIPSLIVRCRDSRLAIPQASISELVRIKAQDVASKIEKVKNAEVFRLRGNLLPLVRLDRALELNGEPDQQGVRPMNIIVVETGHLQYGLIVDGLHDSEEIVVKPLGRHMQGCHCLAGATILGDGRVALILDVAGIAAHCDLALPEADDGAVDGEKALTGSRDAQAVLLFSNHPSEQFGVPMGVIARLERIRSDQIDSVGGKELLQYRGASLPLLSLEKHTSARPRPESEKVYVVVFSVLRREVGLIVPSLIDARDVSTDVDTTTLREPGVVGSVEVDHKATRLLDLYELTRTAYPEWFKADQAGQPQTIVASGKQNGEHHTPIILLAEDSDFFRKQVTGYMEEAGYKVVGCEDGLIAWNVLQEPDQHIDLVVTDIEMPNMDGCQLSRSIKNDPDLAHLPVIALTSLASEEHMQRGMESGIDDYQIKLDRERLIVSIARYLQETKNQADAAGAHAVADMGSQS